MKVFFRRLPAFFCGILLGAHFLRWGHPVLMLLCALFPAVLFSGHKNARIAVQVFLGVGFFVWSATAWRLVGVRMEYAEPWVRMAIILGSVAAFNLVAAGLLLGDRPKKD